MDLESIACINQFDANHWLLCPSAFVVRKLQMIDIIMSALEGVSGFRVTSPHLRKPATQSLRSRRFGQVVVFIE
jgi:hypothetical protein